MAYLEIPYRSPPAAPAPMAARDPYPAARPRARAGRGRRWRSRGRRSPSCSPTLPSRTICAPSTACGEPLLPPPPPSNRRDAMPCDAIAAAAAAAAAAALPQIIYNIYCGHAAEPGLSRWRARTHTNGGMHPVTTTTTLRAPLPQLAAEGRHGRGHHHHGAGGWLRLRLPNR
jgi:hypothetical protein